MNSEKKAEILKLAAMLMSNLPCRLPSGYDIQMAMEGYAMALEDCDLGDISAVVASCIKGVPVKYDWCPQPAVVAQLARDAKARRVNHNPEHVEALPPPDPVVSDKVRAKRAAKVIKFLGPMSHEQWVQECIRYGTIKPYVAP